jgi:hypothetical protein
MEDIKMRDSNDLREMMLVSGGKADEGTASKSGQGTEEKAGQGTEEKTCAGAPEKCGRRMPLRMPALPGDDVSSQEM